MNRLLIKTLLVIATIGLAACASDLDKRMVRMGNTSDFKVSELKRADVNGLLKVQVQVENAGNSKPVSYRFRWVDQAGMMVGGVEGWKPLPVEKGRIEIIEGVAPTPEVKDFRLELNSY